MSDDLINPKMDRAFALETIDAYPADQPPTSSSDRFWFELAARFLAADVSALERELAEARASIARWEAKEVHEAMKCWQDNEQLKADLAAARAEVERAARWFFDMGRTGEHPHGTVFAAAWSRYLQERQR